MRDMIKARRAGRGWGRDSIAIFPPEHEVLTFPLAEFSLGHIVGPGFLGCTMASLVPRSRRAESQSRELSQAPPLQFIPFLAELRVYLLGTHST